MFRKSKLFRLLFAASPTLAAIYLYPARIGYAISCGGLHPEIAISEHRTADLSVVVLEGKIPMPGTRSSEIRQFTGDPDLIESLLYSDARLAIQLADGDNPAFLILRFCFHNSEIKEQG